MMCEKCWEDAYRRNLENGKGQPENYIELVKERNASGKICTPKEQAGQWWDKEKQIDIRLLKKKEAK